MMPHSQLPSDVSETSGNETGVEDLEASKSNGTPETCGVPYTTPTSSGRYLLTAFHARGGMGEIWRCRDATVGREVAMKRLVRDRAASRDRFLCEAQITGQLEHPGVIPVHDLGFDENGEPYYVMKFIHGRTLKSAVSEFHSTQDGGRAIANDKGTRELRLVRMLKIFVDLCNTVAYAHSRGVLHRDLKPDNVMLGPYGETIVVDWGLAKLHGRADAGRNASDDGPPPEPTSPGESVRPSFSNHSERTEDGSILGSPLYMPPEMAEGLHGDEDARTDVYLLGATLYEILTGRPPRSGTSRDEILQLARTAPPLHPRKLAPETPRALEAICLKAMSHFAPQRYPSATALADDVQRFLAGDPVSARRESVAARAWRWAKRHRRLLSRGAIAAVLVALAAVAFTQSRNASRVAMREQARSDVQRVRTLADEASFYAAGIDPPSESAPYYDPGRGRQIAESAIAAADAWGTTLEHLPLPDERDALRQELADTCLLLAQLRLQDRGIRGTTTDRANISALLDRADALRGGATRGSHSLRAVMHRELGNTDLAAREQSVSENAATPVTAYDLFLEGERARVGTVNDAAIPLLHDVGERQQRAIALRQAIECYQGALKKDPSHFWSRLQLGRCYLAAGRGPEAVEVLSACVALRENVPWGYTARGLALGLLGRYDEARIDLDRAISLDPTCVPARLNRAAVSLLEGRNSDVDLDLAPLLSGPSPQTEAMFYRGQSLLRRGDVVAATTAFQHVVQERPHYLPAYVLLAKAQLMSHRTTDAMLTVDQLYAARQARPQGRITNEHAARGRLLQLIAAKLPADRQRPALEAAADQLAIAIKHPEASVETLADYGTALQSLNRLTQAVEVQSKALARSPDNLQLRISRAWALDALDRLPEAITDFEEAINIHPDHAEALAGLGYVMARSSRLIEAERYASLALLHANADYLVLHNVACIYGKLSETNVEQRTSHEDAAIDLLDEAVRLWRAAPGGPNELEFIQREPAFPATLRERKEFRQLLEDGGHSRNL